MGGGLELGGIFGGAGVVDGWEFGLSEIAGCASFVGEWGTWLKRDLRVSWCCRMNANASW